MTNATTTETAPEAEAAGCPVTHTEQGCPVIHEEFAGPRPVGAHWALGDRLREEAPVFWNNQAQGWHIFTHMDAVRDIYKDNELFSSESITPWDPEPNYRLIPTMIDEPLHGLFRKLVNPWFTASRVARKEDVAREICKRLVEETAPLGQTNFVKTFALRYPTEMFLKFVGMDLADTEKFLVWTEDFFSGYGGDPEAEARFNASVEGLNTYWVDAIADRRSKPLDESDFASYCVHTKLDDGRHATDGELIELMTLMVIGGLDTVRSQLSYLIWHLARHPEDRKRLIDEPEVIPYAVEETLRFYGMTFGDGRKVTRDTEFHGIKLKKGETVWALVGSANRDPKQFEQANEYIIDRKKNQHATFALGRHRCLGMHLARAEMKIATEEWLRVIPDFWIDTHQPLMERGAGSMLSLTDLPLAWEPKA